MLRLPSVPSVEVWACAKCGHRYYNGTWADAETPDDDETYKYHWRKVKARPQVHARTDVLPREGVSCRLGNG